MIIASRGGFRSVRRSVAAAALLPVVLLTTAATIDPIDSADALSLN
jgi:hypothetical protein